MKNLLKLSLFALALGFFASCGDSDKPAESTPATETPAATPAPAPAAPAANNDSAAKANTPAPAADTTKKP